MAKTIFKNLYPQNYIVYYEIFAVFLPSKTKKRGTAMVPLYY
nr:MAG TPA: hypothetical protein [Caudoviricetes sp.]DAY26941.1 MAG TPA: hypothetical protein [Caudoviricetes sp.]